MDNQQFKLSLIDKIFPGNHYDNETRSKCGDAMEMFVQRIDKINDSLNKDLNDAKRTLSIQRETISNMANQIEGYEDMLRTAYRVISRNGRSALQLRIEDAFKEKNLKL